MSVNAIHKGSGQQVQDEVLSLIRTRSQPATPGRGASEASAPSAPHGEPVRPDTAIAHINEALQALGTDLRFEVDQDSREVVVKVVDHGTGEVLRQIPNEAALQVARSLDKLVGRLVDHKV